jgi:voltage-gated potassium channel
MVFTLEFALRLWSCVESEHEELQGKIWGRINYLFSANGLIDLVVIAPFFFNIFNPIPEYLYDVLSVLVVFKLYRYWNKIIDFMIILLILVDVVFSLLESVDAIKIQFGSVLKFVEYIAVIIFTAEYVIRFITSVNVGEEMEQQRRPIRAKIIYIFSALGIIDLLSVLPYYLQNIYQINDDIYNVLRIIVILKIIRYSYSLRLLLTVLKRESKTFFAALFITMIVALFASGIVYIFEYEANPEIFSSVPKTLYYVIATLTTVGYGDIVTTTTMGQFFSSIICIAGIIITALPAGILATAIANHIKASRERFEQKIEKAVRFYGVLPEKEKAMLFAEGSAIGLTGSDVGKIIDFASHSSLAFSTCPHCGMSLNATASRKSVSTSNVRSRSRR